MSDDPGQRSRLQKHLDIPARWTDDQPNFLRFSFPANPPGQATPSLSPAKLERIRRALRTHHWGNRHFAIAGVFSDLQAAWATKFGHLILGGPGMASLTVPPSRRKISLRFGKTGQFLDFLVCFRTDGD